MGPKPEKDFFAKGLKREAKNCQEMVSRERSVLEGQYG